jgi:hypothetical protein
VEECWKICVNKTSVTPFNVCLLASSLNLAFCRQSTRFQPKELLNHFVYKNIELMQLLNICTHYTLHQVNLFNFLHVWKTWQNVNPLKLSVDTYFASHFICNVYNLVMSYSWVILKHCCLVIQMISEDTCMHWFLYCCEILMPVQGTICVWVWVCVRGGYVLFPWYIFTTYKLNGFPRHTYFRAIL